MDPNQKFTFTLDIEDCKPEDRRIRFTSRFLSAGMLSRIDELTDVADGAVEGDGRKLLVEALLLAGVSMAPPDAYESEESRLTLDIQAAKPPEERTIFVMRTKGPETASVIIELLQKSMTHERASIRIGQMISELQSRLIRVEGPPAEFNDLTVDEIEELIRKTTRLARLSYVTILDDLSVGDLWEVCLKMIRLSRLTEIERKKSALQSASAAAAKSARTVRLASV